MLKLPNFFPFSHGLPVVMGCHFSGIYDVNRSSILPDDDFSIIQEWADSLQIQSVNTIVFHNKLSSNTCQKFQHKQLHFIKVDFDTTFSPNVFRYLVYDAFLQLHASKISAVFITDVSDVVMVNNPFLQPLFATHPNALFCGDEPKTLNDPWMQEHGSHLRNTITDYKHFENICKNLPLLNCGIIGGNMPTVQPFINQLAQLHFKFNRNNSTQFTGDMGAFNYLVRTHFQNEIFHGFPVNTIFKKYENQRQDCWFRHK